MITNLPRTQRLAAASVAGALLLSALSGCVSRSGSPLLVELRPPKGDAPLPEEIWERTRVEKNPRQNTQSSLFFPFMLYNKAWRFNSDQESASFTRLRWYDLGLPIFLLPFYAGLIQREYRRDSTETGRMHATVTPFWAWSGAKNWPEDRARVKASGLPLLFTNIRVEDGQPRTKVQSNLFLWTLGPAISTFRSENLNVGEDDAAGPGRLRGYVGAPLLLGGLPGAILWSSYSIRWQDETREGSVFGQGPLLGTLLYFQSKENVRIPTSSDELDDRTPDDTTRLLGLGALWYSHAGRNAEGRVMRSDHGPLWGFLGWGRRDGAFALKLFWFGIPLGPGEVTDPPAEDLAEPPAKGS